MMTEKEFKEKFPDVFVGDSKTLSIKSNMILSMINLSMLTDYYPEMKQVLRFISDELFGGKNV